MGGPMPNQDLRRLSDEATPGPWAYRSQQYDDWGTVRSGPDENGDTWTICRARDPRVFGEGQLAAHRAAGTDPWEATARFIVECVNHVRATLEAGDRALEKIEAVERLARACGQTVIADWLVEIAAELSPPALKQEPAR